MHSSNHPGTAHQPRDGLPAARSSTHTTTSRPSQELDTLLPSCTATLTHTAAEQRSPSVGADGRDGEIMGLPDIRATHNDGEPASSNQQGLPYRHPDDGGTAAAAADGAGGGGANGPVFGAPTGRQHHYVHSTWGPVPPCAGSGPLGHHEALELSRELHASLSALRGGSSRHHEAEHHQQQQVALEPWAVLLSAAKAVGSKSGHAGGPKRHTVHGMLGRTQDRGVEGLSGPLQGVDRRSSSLAGAHPNILTLMSVAPELRQQQQWDVVIDKAEAGPGASGPTAEVMGSSAPAAGEARAAGSSAVTRSVPGTAAGMRRPAPATGASTVGGPDPGQEMSFAVPLATGAAAAADSGPVAAAAPAASAAVVAEPADQCTRPPTTACSLASAGAATTPVAVAAAAASPQNPEKPDGGIFISSSTIQEYSQAEARSLDTPGYRHCDNTTNSDTAGSTRRALVAQDLPTAEAALNIDSSGGGDPASPSSRTSYAERMDVLRLTHIESFSGIGVVNFLGCFDDSSRVTVKLTEIPQGLGLPPSAFSAACSSSNPGQQLTVPEGPSAMDRHPVAAALSAPAPAPGVPSCPHCSMPMRRQTQGGRRTSALSTASSGSDSGSNDCVSVRVSACDTDRSGYCCCAEYRRGTEGGRDTGHSSAGQAGTGDAASETWFHDQCREALQSATEIGVLTALNHPNILQVRRGSVRVRVAAVAVAMHARLPCPPRHEGMTTGAHATTPSQPGMRAVPGGTALACHSTKKDQPTQHVYIGRPCPAVFLLLHALGLLIRRLSATTQEWCYRTQAAVRLEPRSSSNSRPTAAPHSSCAPPLRRTTSSCRRMPHPLLAAEVETAVLCAPPCAWRCAASGATSAACSRRRRRGVSQRSRVRRPALTAAAVGAVAAAWAWAWEPAESPAASAAAARAALGTAFPAGAIAGATTQTRTGRWVLGLSLAARYGLRVLALLCWNLARPA